MDKTEFSFNTVDEATAKKLLGIKGWFLKGEKRQAVLTSKLVDLEIKKRKKSGQTITKAEIEKIKFACDSIYRQKVIDKIHNDCDKEYNQNIKKCEKNIHSLEKSIPREINRIEESRWENIVDRNLRFNLTEGILVINNSRFPFSSIKGAAVNLNQSYRVETSETGKSKKHASVGGAVVGGLMFGAVGAIVGGTALGKTTHQGSVNTNNIPTANHLGVIVDLNGFQSEIILLNKTVDQDSNEFKEAVDKAQKIITKLQYLSTVPVPESFLRADEEQSVIDLKNALLEAHRKLDEAKANVPKYEIPEKYL